MRILVVEDSRSLADGIAEGLRDQGMAVDVAYDGRDAAAKLDLSPYHVVVLDRDLPGLHGDTLCRMITDSGDGRPLSLSAREFAVLEALSEHIRPSCPPKISSNRHGTSTPIRSPTSSLSPSAGSAANSANPRLSAPSPTSATTS